jgi:radical S-adenosyl methionine domain-containing protein 2
MHVQQMTKEDAFTIIDKLAEAGLRKITFAGGEPMLYKYLDSCIRHSKEIGLTTSIITNGSLLTADWLAKMMSYLDWVGLSVDSLNLGTQQLIGRVWHKKVPYQHLVELIHLMGFRLKINTVVNAYNFKEDMSDFMRWANPDRWKVFQALRIEGQNDTQFDEIKVSEDQYLSFISRHRELSCMVPENNEAMTGSYLLIDPQGRLFENSAGKHTYSQPLQKSSVEKCLSEINLNREMFVNRGGIYNW